MYPSVKTLQRRLGVSYMLACELRGILDGTIDLNRYASVQRRVAQAYNPPDPATLKLEALNEALCKEKSFHGVESFCYQDRAGDGCYVDYIDAGDTYGETILYNGRSWVCGTWGDRVEALERRGCNLP